MTTRVEERLGQYLEELSVCQGFTYKLLHVSTDNKQGGHRSHQHPGKDEREAHPTGKKQHKESQSHYCTVIVTCALSKPTGTVSRKRTMTNTNTLIAGIVPF